MPRHGGSNARPARISLAVHPRYAFCDRDLNVAERESMMWVFGYGSLMWDRWEDARGCARRVPAKLCGYCRAFNKASVRNWGTKANPGPTLNLVQSNSAHCRGLAFQFPDDRRKEISEYLTEREGRNFALLELPLQLDVGDEIAAIVPIYNGNNLIPASSVKKIAKMVLRASGTEGTCLDYVTGIVEELRRLGIEDSAVAELWHALTKPGMKP